MDIGKKKQIKHTSNFSLQKRTGGVLEIPTSNTFKIGYQ